VSDDPLRLQPIDDFHLAVSEYERIVEKEALEDELQLAQDRVRDLERQLYACERNLEEQIRLTDQARGLAMAYLDEVKRNPRERYNLREWRRGRAGEPGFYDIPDLDEVPE
jgi:hypothetical protein